MGDRPKGNPRLVILNPNRPPLTAGHEAADVDIGRMLELELNVVASSNLVWNILHTSREYRIPYSPGLTSGVLNS